MRLRLVSLLGASAAAALALAPISGSASRPVHTPTVTPGGDTIVFAGDSGTLSTPVLISGTAQAGTYSFAGSGACVENGQVCPTATITSNGNFVNDANGCGTGTAQSSTDATIAGPTETETAKYLIDFNDGIGTFDPTLSALTDTDDGANSVTGVVVIAGDAPGNCVTGINSFRVVGYAQSTSKA